MLLGQGTGMLESQRDIIAESAVSVDGPESVFMPDTTTVPFAHLSPDRVANAIESLGFYLQSEPFALNSYENRVYLFQDDDGRRWVAKFYRPLRWSDEAILDEHRFVQALHAEDVSVGAVWENEQGRTLHHVDGYRLSIFNHISGRAPALDAPDDLFALGELIGQLHHVAQHLTLPHRPILSWEGMARQAQETVLSTAPLTVHQRSAYLRITTALMALFETLPQESELSYRPLHGDCHIGNVLGDAEHGFALVDFDDCMTGPAVQDIWMFLSGDREDERRQQLSELIEGYESWCEFDRRQLVLIEPLATLRMMRHAAWLLARWHDPAFPLAFPDINQSSYWDQHLRTLEGQLQALSSPLRLA